MAIPIQQKWIKESTFCWSDLLRKSFQIRQHLIHHSASNPSPLSSKVKLVLPKFGFYLCWAHADQKQKVIFKAHLNPPKNVIYCSLKILRCDCISFIFLGFPPLYFDLMTKLVKNFLSWLNSMEGQLSHPWTEAFSKDREGSVRLSRKRCRR